MDERRFSYYNFIVIIVALTVTSTDMKTTAVVIDDIAANESGTTVHPQPEHGHMFFAASTAKVTER